VNFGSVFATAVGVGVSIGNGVTVTRTNVGSGSDEVESESGLCTVGSVSDEHVSTTADIARMHNPTNVTENRLIIRTSPNAIV